MSKLSTAVQASRPPEEEVVASFRTSKVAEHCGLLLTSRGSSVGTATGPRVERRKYRGSIPGKGQEVLSSLKRLFQWVPELLSQV